MFSKPPVPDLFRSQWPFSITFTNVVHRWFSFFSWCKKHAAGTKTQQNTSSKYPRLPHVATRSSTDAREDQCPSKTVVVSQTSLP